MIGALCSQTSYDFLGDLLWTVRVTSLTPYQLYSDRNLQDFGPGSAAPYNLFSHMALLEAEWDGSGLSPLQR